MGKRGPKPRKTAALGARLPAAMRKRLEEAATANKRTLSGELEARLAYSFDFEQPSRDEACERAFQNMILRAIKGASTNTGQDWLQDPYTFELAVSAVVRFLERFRPEGEAKAPDTMAMTRDLPPGHPWREQLSKMFAAAPPDTLADAIAGGIVIQLQQAAAGSERPDLAPYWGAAEYLAGLLTDPVLKTSEDKP
jgi:hypothetical protein